MSTISISHIDHVAIHILPGGVAAIDPPGSVLSALGGAELSAAMASAVPPAAGQPWRGQGGIYIGTMPAHGDTPAYHLIAADPQATPPLTWGSQGEDEPGAKDHYDGAANTAALPQPPPAEPQTDPPPLTDQPARPTRTETQPDGIRNPSYERHYRARLAEIRRQAVADTFEGRNITAAAAEWKSLPVRVRLLVLVFSGVDGDHDELLKRDWREIGPGERMAISACVSELKRSLHPLFALTV
ncbi:MAG: hypothetical protein GAK30_01551 [Paracidovorax wautersii]|uniref:Uncharacterized protein n=1 Tax=Paracidovorax wautersii TaxID=1177982 RepID=A0A7V8FPN8_9BURK|nr:MAG: hypothetical protein GAK30_01551 [Paracidovorax wautersii]